MTYTPNSNTHSNADNKSLLIAYLLWWFLGFFGTHKFYLGQVVSGILRLGLFLTGVFTIVFIIGFIPLLAAFVLWIADAISMQSAVSSVNRRNQKNTVTTIHIPNETVQNKLQTIEQLHDMKAKGLISNEEFDKMRPQI